MTRSRATSALLGALFGLAATLSADPALRVEPQVSGTTAHLQAVSAVDARVAWVGGRAGTYARTVDGGLNWSAAVVPGAGTAEFRDLHAVDARTAYLMSAGPGDASAIYRTDDGGATWRKTFVNPDAQGFFDCLAFWDARHGLLYGDSVAGRLVAFVTHDGGQRWERVARLPLALPGEGGFASSGGCVQVGPRGRAWIATGAGSRARVLSSRDGARRFSVVDTPVVADESAGLTALAFRDARHGLAVGGRIRGAGPGLRVALTADGGRTWSPAGEPRLEGALYGVAYVPGARPALAVAVGPAGMDVSQDDGRTWRALDDGNTWSLAFAPGAPGIGWAVGPGGRVVRLRSAR